MKKKRLPYILLPVALLVWGLIIYRIWSATSQEDYTPTALAASATPTLAPNDTSRVPELGLNYPDPFLTGRPLTSARPTSAPVTKASAPSYTSFVAPPPPPPPPPPATPAPVPAKVVWPALEYTGAIEHSQKKLRVAMLNVNGTSYLVQENKVEQGLRVMHIYRDSVQLKFGSEIRTLLRGGKTAN